MFRVSGYKKVGSWQLAVGSWRLAIPGALSVEPASAEASECKAWNLEPYRHKN